MFAKCGILVWQYTCFEAQEECGIPTPSDRWKELCMRMVSDMQKDAYVFHDLFFVTQENTYNTRNGQKYKLTYM